MRLIRSEDSFCFMESKTISKIHILDASLLVRRAKISPGVLLAHARMLNKTTAKYPLTRVEVTKLKLSRYTSAIVRESIDNAILGQLPKSIIVGFIDNKTFNSDRKLNSFNFKITYKFLYANGKFPGRYSQIFRKTSRSTLKLITHYSRKPETAFIF